MAKLRRSRGGLSRSYLFAASTRQVSPRSSVFFFEFQTGGISDLVALGKPRGHKICRACHVMSGTIRSHTLKTWEACRTAEPQPLESYSSYRRTNTARCHASFCADPEPALRTTFWRTRRASTLRSSVACLTTSSWFRGRII